ncbi:glycosyltransferase family 2 protein [Ruminococcus sp. JL13D9]|uniref:glycosyltransferase family 2 protein n=1 Tax=Ruminococcus sp. JL13D9 TaxID=3233381 RepID=UPI00389A5E78
MKNSKITVVVPVYKVEKYIKRCIDSILAQTFTEFELILVDDGSPDNCGKICDEYAEKDNRIHVIHKENGGLSDARNVGIDWAFENSNSEWITFIDCDDWIHPRYLEALYDAVKKTGCEISICAYEETTGDNPQVDESHLEAEIVNTEDFFCEHNVNAVVAWGKLYKKELFREIRYPVGKLHEDEFTTYKLLFQYENCAFVNQPLYSYFINNAGITKVSWTTRRLDAFEAFDNQLSFFKENRFKKAYAKVLDSIAYTCSIHIKAIDNDYENRHYKCLLRKKLSKHLKKYKNQVGFSIKKTPMYYEYAYPTLMKYYWLIISQIKKQKGKKNV